MTEMTSELFNTNNDDIITRIFDAKFTTQSIETSKDDDTTEEVNASLNGNEIDNK